LIASLNGGVFDDLEGNDPNDPLYRKE